MVFDDADDLVGRLAIMARDLLDPEARPTPSCQSDRRRSVLKEGGCSSRAAACRCGWEDTDILLGAHVHSDGIDFTSVLVEVTAQFQFPI